MPLQTTQPEGPLEYCDLVMKGGITSGVVYPLAITELAQRYRFKNIGGTSAGAIAAVITAAAEYGRRTDNNNSYNVVQSLPTQLGKEGFLLGLFRPSGSTKKVFRIFIRILRFHSTFARVMAALGGVIAGFWYWGLLGLVLGASPAIYCFHKYGDGGPKTPYILLGSLWAIVFSAIVLLTAVVKHTLRCICSNKFGLCSGFAGSSKDGPLTVWLHDQVQKAAGNPKEPVTFGDLWSSPPFPNEQLKTPRTINLQVVTTNLTQGRPFTIPFESREFYFEESEFRQLFPSEIADWLMQKAPASTYVVKSPSGLPLVHIPDAKDFPIVVAARMSLSFPILLSAVPLYQVDFSLKRNANPKPKQELTAERCWFSDGGICSNFPIQFFDSPLPRWPTFGIDLKAPHPDFPDEADFVWLPNEPWSGKQVAWNEFDTGSSRKQIMGFFGAIINTMQNWRDNLQATSSGYRDRIVHVSLRPDEGGLNLNMPSALITLLSERGRRAGSLLKAKFNLGSHIFGRYRITMCGIEAYLKDLCNSWTQPLPQDADGWDYVKGTKQAPHYRPSPPLLAALLHALEELVQLSNIHSSTTPPGQSFCDDGAPMPEPVLRSQPKF